MLSILACRISPPNFSVCLPMTLDSASLNCICPEGSANMPPPPPTPVYPPMDRVGAPHSPFDSGRLHAGKPSMPKSDGLDTPYPLVVRSASWWLNPKRKSFTVVGLKVCVHPMV